MKYFLNMLVLLIFGFSVQGQDKVFTMEEYLEQVMDHHPVIYKADLLQESAIANKRMARGGFDPKIAADWNQKRFKETNYYALGSGKLKVPTWFGIDAELGYDQTSGDFINNSDFLPARGLWNAGISVPIGRGFIIDERRAELKQADILIDMTKQEQILLRNEVIFDALSTYLYWQQAEAFLEIAKEGVDLAQDRLQATISSFEEGDKPAIDTLEATISLRTRETELLKAEQALENIRINIENYLWVEGYVPLVLENDVMPEEINLDRFDDGVNEIMLTRNQILQNHPELLLYNFKFEQLELDRKLAREDLKPDLRIDYNPLVGLGDNSLISTFNPGDYKLGASFNYPIVQRKQRGKLDLIDVKIKDTEIDLALKQQMIRTKMLNFENNINQSIEQRQLFTAMVVDYSDLLIAERKKFDIGESSIFLINSREVKYLESQYKSVEASTKVLNFRLKYFYVLGVMESYVFNN
jgi:outer membrane protein TolC